MLPDDARVAPDANCQAPPLSNVTAPTVSMPVIAPLLVRNSTASNEIGAARAGFRLLVVSFQLPAFARLVPSVPVHASSRGIGATEPVIVSVRSGSAAE